MATSPKNGGALPKHRGHRGEILAHAMHLGSSGRSDSVFGVQSASPSAQDPGGKAPPPNVRSQSISFGHRHGSVRAGLLSAVLSTPGSTKHFFARGGSGVNIVREISDLKAAHMDGRKVSSCDAGKKVHSGFLNMHDQKHAAWVKLWCVVADDATLYLCPDKGQESMAALPLSIGQVIDVSEKEMAHPLCIEIQFPLTPASPSDAQHDESAAHHYHARVMSAPDNCSVGASTESLMLRADNIGDKRAWVRALSHVAGSGQSG